MTVPVDTVALATVKKTPSRNPLSRLYRTPTGLFGVFWMGVLIVLSFTYQWWAPFGVTEQDPTAILAGPSARHLLGTDELGRDILTRIFASSGDTLTTAALAVVVTLIVAIPLALTAAASGGRVRAIIDRVTEVVMSLPGTVILIALIGAIGVNLPVVMSVLGVLFSAGMYRVFVGQATSLQKSLYVDAARIDGLGAARTSVRHVLPGLTGTILAQASLIFAIGMMIQVGLAFIGFGPPLPYPSWGGMIASASQYVYNAPWMMVPTGAVLALTVLAANAIGDTLSYTPDQPRPQIVLGKAAREREEAMRAARADSAGASPADTTALLEVSGLAIGVDNGPGLVSDVSFRVHEGTVMGLVGESGCGKTITSHTVIGLLTPGLSVRGGAIWWSGRNLAQASEADMMKVRGHEIAFISQEPLRALDPMFTVEWQLAGAVRRLRRVSKTEARTIAARLLSDVGIVDVPRVLRSYPHQISGGMAQRVAIALALAGRPRLLVADEPTTALDVTVQAEILALLRGLVEQRGMSIVLVTHDFGVVADICDEVSVMYAGRVVEHGSVRDVLVRPEHAYTKALLAADPHRGRTEDGRLREVAPVWEAGRTLPDGGDES